MSGSRLSSSDTILWGIAVVWLAFAGGALFAMAEYGAVEGRADAAPVRWPEGLHTMIEPDPARATLVLFAHPLCPCTRATLWELESITNRLHGMVDLHVLFYEPQNTGNQSDLWEASALKKLAARLPGTHLHKDVEGEIARHFGAYTSGQLLLYGTDGNLQFAGGITPSRGHTGANPGKAMVISSILGDEGIDPFNARINPVYGCSIHEQGTDDRKLETGAV